MKLCEGSLTAPVHILLCVRVSYHLAQGYLLYRNMIPLRFHTFLQDEADLRLEEDLARLREEPVTGRQFQELHLAHFDPNTRQPLLYFDHLDPGPGGLGVADKGGRPLSMIV